MQVSISSGSPKRKTSTYSFTESEIQLSISKACDRMVKDILGIPGFFSGRICFLSSVSGKKEIFVADALMTICQTPNLIWQDYFQP